MNFTDSPFEQMMKEVPRPGRGSSEMCIRDSISDTGISYGKQRIKKAVLLD